MAKVPCVSHMHNPIADRDDAKDVYDDYMGTREQTIWEFSEVLATEPVIFLGFIDRLIDEWEYCDEMMLNVCDDKLEFVPEYVADIDLDGWKDIRDTMEPITDWRLEALDQAVADLEEILHKEEKLSNRHVFTSLSRWKFGDETYNLLRDGDLEHNIFRAAYRIYTDWSMMLHLAKRGDPALSHEDHLTFRHFVNDYR